MIFATALKMPSGPCIRARQIAIHVEPEGEKAHGIRVKVIKEA